MYKVVSILRHGIKSLASRRLGQSLKPKFCSMMQHSLVEVAELGNPTLFFLPHPLVLRILESGADRATHDFVLVKVMLLQIGRSFGHEEPADFA